MSHKTYLRLYENAPPEKQSRADASGENVGYGNRINSSVASNVCGLSFRVIRTIQKMIVLMLAQHCKYIYKAPNVYFPWVHFTVCDLCPNIKILQGETVGMLVELSLGMYISHDRAPRVPILATPLQVLAFWFGFPGRQQVNFSIGSFQLGPWEDQIMFPASAQTNPSCCRHQGINQQMGNTSLLLSLPAPQRKLKCYQCYTKGRCQN